ncbi:MAG: DNA polymerase III subunit gamma/tau, partial [Caulobacter sp.]
MADTDAPLEPPPWEEDLQERDPDTADIFGAPEPAPEVTPAPAPPEGAAEGQAPGDGAAYTVLARKYRPRTFEDLIGQE